MPTQPLPAIGRFFAARWRVGALVLVATLIWIAHYGKWTRASWQLPTDYFGDAPEILAQMRAAADGELWPLVPKVIDRLGAPFGAYWNAFPTPDKPLMLLAGGLTNWIGLFPAANLVLLIAQVSAGLSFYFVARWLRCRWEWAWAGALLFTFTYHTFHRGLAHFSISITWTVPLGLLAVWLVARSRRLEWRSAGAAVCLGAAVVLGVSNPYNLLFWLQLMGWAVIAQWCDRRRRQNLAIGLTAIGVAAVTFVAANIEVWLYTQEPDARPLIERNYGGTEIYALKPMEMIVPPAYHRWGALAFWGNRYLRWSDWRGEVFLPYLGLVGVAGLAWLGIVTARRLFARQAPPGQALSVGWLVGYATVGGVTNVLALFVGLQIFRATNRVAIFISALVLMFLIVRLSRLTVRWPAWSRVAAALGVAALGVFDQVPKEASPAEAAELAAAVRSDEKFGRELEVALAPEAMIFQLPVMGFPEVTPPFRLGGYELFRPYLVTRTLRFTYGAAKFRARSRWQRDLENAPATTLVRRLEAYGFAALLLNSKGYEDRAERLLKDFTRLGYTRQLTSESGNQVAVLLHPSPRPELPLGRMLTFGQGWFPRLEEGVRWANDDAVMSYHNPHPHPITAELRLSLIAVDDRELTLECDGRPLGRVRAGATPGVLRLPSLLLEPGVNVFVLRTEAPAVRLGTGRYQLRAFGLKQSSIKVIPPVAVVE